MYTNSSTAGLRASHPAFLCRIVDQRERTSAPGSLHGNLASGCRMPSTPGRAEDGGDQRGTRQTDRPGGGP